MHAPPLAHCGRAHACLYAHACVLYGSRRIGRLRTPCVVWLGRSLTHWWGFGLWLPKVVSAELGVEAERKIFRMLLGAHEHATARPALPAPIPPAPSCLALPHGLPLHLLEIPPSSLS